MSDSESSESGESGGSGGSGGSDGAWTSDAARGMYQEQEMRCIHVRVCCVHVSGVECRSGHGQCERVR